MSGAERATVNAPAKPAVQDGTLSARPAVNEPAGPVVDADPERALLTERLLDRLAAQLGFRAADTQVRVDDEAARRTGAHGARGLATDGTIWLHPNGYDPRTADGRALLAHEATHLAQRAITAPTTTVHAAEVEAASAAEDFAEGRVLTRPSVPLSVPAFDTGVATTLPEHTPTPAPTTKEAYASDIVVIRTNLDAGIFDGVDANEVSTVLLLLDQYDLGTATAIMREVGTPYRGRLANHADDGHRRRHRQSVLACYGAMTSAERQDRDATLFNGMALSDLAPTEHATVIEVLRDLSDQTLSQLLDGALRARVLTLMQTPVDDQVQKDQHEAVLAALNARVESRAILANDKELRTLITSVGQLLASPDTAKAHQALDAMRRLAPAPPAKGADRTPTAQPRSAELTHVVAELEEAGAVTKLIDAVPDDERIEGDHFGDVLLEVIRHRPTAANLASIQDLLSFGFLDYLPLLGRRAPKAWLAYQIVRRLPPADQDRWQKLDNGKWFRRLEDNIPDGRREKYEGVVVEQDQQGRFVDVASRLADALTGPAGRGVWTTILAECREGIDASTAPDLLRMINTAGEDLPAEKRPPELRRAVVVRLDQLRMLDRILGALSDHWLFEIDHLTLLRDVMALREPGQLRRQVHELIRRNFWRQLPVFGYFFSAWSVSAREAFLAFQLARLLPEADRSELEATGQWGAMVDAMTQEMRQASGMNLFTDRAGTERERVLERLRDNRLWRADRAAELRTLVRMAIELGQRRFVFDRSRETRAYEVPALRPMVDRFGLYAEPGRTTYQPEQVRTPEGRGFFGAIAYAAGWLWSAGSVLAHSLRLGRNEVGVEDLDLTRTQDLFGADNPAKLAESSAGTNRLTLLYNPRDGVLKVDLPELKIAALNQLSAGLGIKANEITLRGLKVRATFPAQRLDQPAAVQLDLSEATLLDLLVTGDDLLVGIARIAMRQLALNLSRTGIDEPVPAPPGSDYSLPIPILGSIIAFVVDVVRRVSYVRRTKRATAQLQGLRVSVDDIELEGVAFGAGVTAKSLRIKDILAGAGLNRSAYLHALREVLQRRLGRASAEQRPDLERRIAETDDAMRRLAARDQRLAELQAKYVRDPDSLGEAERHEAAALERELSGGAVLDVGSLEVQGVGGDVEVDDAVVTGLTGDVAAPVFGPGTRSVFVTDAERIEEFRRRGPVRPAAGPAELRVRAEKATATGVRQAGEIPTSASLAAQFAALPPGVPAANRDRLADLVEIVRDYEELDARARGLAKPEVTEDDRRMLAAQCEALRFEFGFRAATVEAKGIGADLLIGPTLEHLTLGAGADSFVARDVAAGGFLTAREVTGTGLGVAARNRPPARPGEAERQSATFRVADLRAHDAVIDWAGNRMTEIGVSGIAGDVEAVRAAPGRPPTGYRLPNLTVASATVTGVDYRTPTAWVHSEGTTTVTGITLDAETSGSVITVHHAHIDRLSADRLIVENNGPGAPFRAEVTSGALLNLDVTDLVIGGGGAAPMPGHAEIGGLDQIRFAVAMRTLTGPVSGSGVLSSVTETGAPRLAGFLVVQSLADSPEGGQQINLNGLLLTGAEVRLPNGRVVIRKLGLGASVQHKGDTWTVHGLTIPELRLGAVRWRTADGAEITSTGGAALTGLSAHGSIVAPENQPRRVHVDELRIDAITADHLRYHQDPIDLVVGPRSPAARPGRPPLEIRDIRLRGLDWTAENAFTSGTLDIASAGLEFGGRLAERLKSDAALSLTSVHASFLKGGRLVLRARGSADANVGWFDGTGDQPATTEVTTHVAINELDTGSVAIGPGVIEFGPDDEAGLQMADITVDKIHYWSPDLVLGNLDGSKGAVIRRPRAKFRLELRDARERAAAGGPSASAIRKVVLREVAIEAIEVDGVFVSLKNVLAPDGSGVVQPVEVWLPPGETAVVRGVNLVLPAGGKEITPPASPKGSWTIPDLNLQIAGQGSLSAVLVPALRAKAAGVLESASARLETERVDVGLFSGGGITVDLRRPSLTAIEAVLNSFPEHSLRLRGPVRTPDQGGVRAERVQLDTRTGEVTITELGASRLKYVNAKAGLEVEVDKATLPRDTYATLAGPGRALSGRVPRLNIDGASFRFDFTKAVHHDPDPTFPPEPRPWTALLERLGTFEKVFDSIQANIKLDVHVDVHNEDIPAIDLHRELGISNGRLNYHQVEDAVGPLKHVVKFELLRPSDLVLMIGVPGLPAPGIHLATWRLPKDELAQAQRSDQVRIFRLLDVQGRARDHLDKPGSNAPAEIHPPSTEPGPVELRNIDFALALRSAKPMGFDLHRATGDKNIHGTVTLAPNALADLRLGGRLPGQLRQSRYGLAQARVDAVEVFFGDAEFGTGGITVTDLHDLAFTLNPDWKPQVLTGRIGRATARDITWRVP